MTEVYLVRHAEADSSPERFCGRSNHIALTPKGIEQAHQVGSLLVREGILTPFNTDTALHSSPAVRTLQTAGHALAEAGVTRGMHVYDILQERSHGEAEGQRRIDVIDSAISAQVAEKGLAFKHQGGESMQDVAKRGSEYLASTVNGPEVKKIIAFTHCMFILNAIGKIKGWDYYEIRNRRLPHASVSKLRNNGYGWEVESVGVTS